MPTSQTFAPHRPAPLAGAPKRACQHAAKAAARRPPLAANQRKARRAAPRPRPPPLSLSSNNTNIGDWCQKPFPPLICGPHLIFSATSPPPSPAPPLINAPLPALRAARNRRPPPARARRRRGGARAAPVAVPAPTHLHQKPSLPHLERICAIQNFASGNKARAPAACGRLPRPAAAAGAPARPGEAGAPVRRRRIPAAPRAARARAHCTSSPDPPPTIV
ncbi:MAG: hypothetical protein J3K34DRAFT_423590 [Monoraphidium minutum]|nr:MAG: hypothetical protein J3K34DRAFT_423590 [Monoraphidium minutum]